MLSILPCTPGFDTADAPVLAVCLLLILPVLAVFTPTVLFTLLVYSRSTSAPSIAHTVSTRSTYHTVLDTPSTLGICSILGASGLRKNLVLVNLCVRTYDMREVDVWAFSRAASQQSFALGLRERNGTRMVLDRIMVGRFSFGRGTSFACKYSRRQVHLRGYGNQPKELANIIPLPFPTCFSTILNRP